MLKTQSPKPVAAKPATPKPIPTPIVRSHRMTPELAFFLFGVLKP